MHLSIKNFCLLLCLISYGCIHAQEITPGEDSDWLMETFLLPGGTNGNLVTAISEGPNGFMWFGSFAGLHRYDGHEIITYNNTGADSLNNAGGLTFPNIEHLFWDSQGNLWLSTYGDGVFHLDPLTEVFTHYRHDPADSSSINSRFVHYGAEDAEGNIWFATRFGLAKFDPIEQNFKRYKLDLNTDWSDQNNRARVLYLDKQGTLWTTTGEFYAARLKGGLFRYHADTDSFEGFYPAPDKEGGLGYSPIKELYEDSQGNFWVGTFYGLQLMDRSSGTFTDMPYDPNLPHAPDVNNRPDAPVWSMHEDQNKGLWIGAVSFNDHDKNLSRYDPVSRTTETFPLAGLAWDITESSDGTIWVAGSAIRGVVHRLSREKKKFDLQEGNDIASALDALIQEGEAVGNYSRIRNFTIDPKSNTLWATRPVIYDSDGNSHINIVAKDLSTGQITPHQFTVTSGENINPSWSAVGMEIDDHGNVWFPAKYSGVIKYDPKTRRQEQFLPIEGDSTSLTTNDILYLTRDSRNNIWAAGFEAGLNKIDASTGAIKHYHFSGYFETYPDPNLKADFPISVLEDRQGTIWVAGALDISADIVGGGFLATINPDTDEITYIEVPRIIQEYTIRYMTEDPITGNIAMSLNENGYCIYERTTGTIEFYDPADGSAPFSHVAGLIYDDEGYLWLSDNNKSQFARVNPSSGQAFIFEADSDIIFVSHNRQAQKSPEGHILFKNDYGWSKIDPDRIVSEEVTRTSEIRLVDLQVSGEKQNHFDHSTIDTIISEVVSINLSHAAESFVLRFTDFNFSPDKSVYSYRLYPYEEDWRQIKNEPVANYYKVPPGQYEFQVTASSTKGTIISPLNVKLTIHPPWWKTWWAYTLYAFGTLLLGWSVHKSQRARTIRIEREKTRERELAQAKEIEKAYAELKSTQAQLIQSEKMASLGELMAGIAHEIQNPLNFVNNFSEVSGELIDEALEEIDSDPDEAKDILSDLKTNLEKINHHGKRADSIVKGMLQHSRSDNGEKVPTDINALCDEYMRLAYHGLRAKNQSFNADYKLDLDDQIGKINVVPQDISRVILNIITNAFQACAERERGTYMNQSETTVNTTYAPKVTCTTLSDEGQVIIKIADNGNGIPDDIKEKIFQPFFTTKPTGQGTGLGLSMAYDIIKAHGGELTVESAEGEGSEFVINLPISMKAMNL